MTRQGRGTYAEADDGVMIEVELTRVQEKFVVVWDGSEHLHPITKRKVPKTVSLPVSQIDGGDFEPELYKAGDRVSIMIPNWLALKEGMI